MDALERRRVSVDGLEKLLNEADLVKFAKFTPTPESAAVAINHAREIVILTTPVVSAPDLLAPSPPSEPSEPVGKAS